MENRLLHNNFKSYSLIFIIGIIVGILTRLTDFFPADTLWSLSSVATLFGFWIISVTVIVMCSSSNGNAALSVFLYMFGMTLSFYLLQYILGCFLPMFANDGFKTMLFLVYTFLSWVCGLGAFILFCWEMPTVFGAVLRALPIGALLAETIGVGIWLLNRSVFLFQFLLDGLGFVVLGTIFFRRVKYKAVYLASVCAVAAAVYFAIYRPFL